MTKKADLRYESFGQDEAGAVEGLLRIYGAITQAFSKRGKEERRRVEKYAKTIQKIDPEYRAGYLATVAEVMIEELATPAIEEPAPYSVRSKNDTRALAIMDHMNLTGQKTIKSTEARAVLSALEGKPLDRKIVWRALYRARRILNATVDIVGGVGRLVIHVSLSRPRRDQGPWDT